MEKRSLCWASAVELSQGLASGQLSPVEIVKDLLERIDAIDGTVKAFIHVSRDQALADARAAEAEIGQGNYRGPLHGIPVAYKDIYDVAGLPTTGGSRLLEGHMAAADSAIAANLKAAGAICLGKLNTWEFASGGMEIVGEACNPWNTRMTTGGSSAGSAAALAAHLLPLATGTDTGGSVRDPAAYCGVVGLKPTFGRLCTRGIIPLSWTLDHPGPMARSAGDAALLFHAMAGEQNIAQRLDPILNPDVQSLKKIRIGMPDNYFYENLDAEVEEAVGAAVDHLRTLGAGVKRIAFPSLDYASAASYTIAYTESFFLHRSGFLNRGRDYTSKFMSKISAAAFLTAQEYLVAQQIRQRVTREFLDALAEVDLIVTPSVSYPAHPHQTTPPQSQVRSLARPISLTGLPALSIPCGFTQTQLPIGMQLIGRANEEATLFQIAGLYEMTTEWRQRQAPVQPGDLWDPPLPSEPRAENIDTESILKAAELLGLAYVDAHMAEAIVAQISPVKAILREAQAHIVNETIGVGQYFHPFKP